MTRFLALALFALAASAEAGVCRPRPKPNTTVPAPEAGSSGGAYPSASGGSEGLSSAPLPVPSGNSTSTGGNVTVTGVSVSASISIGSTVVSASVSSAPSVAVTVSSAPLPSSSSPATAPPAPGTPPPGTDTSKPWNPVDPTGSANITANPTAADIDGTSNIAQWLLTYHNVLRAQYGAGALKWDAGLAQKSANWARRCVWEHEGFDNLAQQSARNLPLNYGVDSFLDMWADEWPQTFAGGDPVNGRVVVLNHLTQMVWKSDTVVGCSWNVDCTEPGMDHSVFLSCVYGPGGNVVGQQDQEVGNYIPS